MQGAALSTSANGLSNRVGALPFTCAAVGRGLGFGRLGYMLMLDWFGIFNIVILTSGLILTVLVHGLSQKGRFSLARTINAAGVLMTFLLYTIGLSGFMLYAESGGDTGATVAYGIIMCAAVLGGMLTYVAVSTKRRHGLMEELATHILKDDFAEKDAQARHAMLQTLFTTFDSDRSGHLDEKEAEVLVRVLHRKLQDRKEKQHTSLTRSASAKLSTAAAAVITVGPLQLRKSTRDPEVDALVQRMRLNVPGGVTLDLLKAAIDDFLSYGTAR